MPLRILPIYEVRPSVDGAVMSYNYGFDKLRFLSPVLAGARIRAHFDLAKLEERKPGEILSTYDVTVEIEGQAGSVSWYWEKPHEF